jgi:hypothetical protein
VALSLLIGIDKSVVLELRLLYRIVMNLIMISWRFVPIVLLRTLRNCAISIFCCGYGSQDLKPLIDPLLNQFFALFNLLQGI